MPAFRNVRRSRRLSRQPPRDPGSDEFDLHDFELMYPDDGDANHSPAAAEDAQLPAADESGEPEIDVHSPPLPTTKLVPLSSPRSSHSRKKKPGHIPRPPNAFMIFRSELWSKEKIKADVERDHRQISRIAGSLWNALSDEERAPYVALAEEAKQEHHRKYPEYKYSPTYRRDKPGKRKPKQDHSDKVHRCNEVARLMQRGFVGDSLKRELERRQNGGDDVDDDMSDSSEYVDTPQRKKAVRQASKKASSSRARARRERAKDAEYIPVSLQDAPIHNAFSMENSASPAVSPISEQEDFVPTSEIPPLDLGEACFDDEGIKSGSTFTSTMDGDYSPGSSCLSDDFLASPNEALFLSQSLPLSPVDPDIYEGALLVDANGFLYDPLIELPPEHPYSPDEYYPGDIGSDALFSEWIM
ncbi:hypothetical protein C8Q78DRAFT_1083184 [Trametes maxima]|nr:hypothetical protein C8Q78DRAFT_1083184 [Trametes maxima]